MPKSLATKKTKSIKKTAEPSDGLILDGEFRDLARAITIGTNKLTELEQRLKRLEKRFKSNERLANSLADCLATQIIAVDAVSGVVRRSLTDDAITQNTLQDAIRHYDKHKIRRFFSGFLSVLLWVGSIAAAACVGAFIYWFAASN